MEQNISNVSSQGNEKKLKYPNFFKNLEILQQNGIYTERRFASDFNIEERKAINNLDLEDGGAKMTEILKSDVSIDTIYNAAKVGINMDNILDMLDLTEKIHRDINDGKSKNDVMFSGNALKGRWCAKFVANRHKEFKVRQLLYSTRHKGWLYIGNGITMIASDLSADVIKRIFPQRQYKYYFVFDQSSETGEGEFENNGK
ncbi:MAG: hypothetical protein K6A67_07445 [Bacteroidales bacterium]|nr:hypothetical protein [Bacteroidales bacterium]